MTIANVSLSMIHYIKNVIYTVLDRALFFILTSVPWRLVSCFRSELLWKTLPLQEWWCMQKLGARQIRLRMSSWFYRPQLWNRLVNLSCTNFTVCETSFDMCIVLGYEFKYQYQSLMHASRNCSSWRFHHEHESFQDVTFIITWC